MSQIHGPYHPSYSQVPSINPDLIMNSQGVLDGNISYYRNNYNDNSYGLKFT